MADTKIIKIFEDRQQKVLLTEQEKKDIVSMKSLIGENNLILQTDGKLLIKHYVGFIQLNRTRLLIYPKISSKTDNESVTMKAFEILIKLLAFSGFTSVKRTPNPQMFDQYNGDLLEIYISFFVDELLLQFKRDINRGYNSILENQSFIKGKVDFVETVKKNCFRKHLHYVKYDQFSENILLNRVFKSVIQNLITKTNCKNNKIKLKKSLLWLEDVEHIHLNSGIWGSIKFTRHNAKYEAAFNMAKLFYLNSSPNLNVGDELAFSFLVPVNRLFEMYLYKVFCMNHLDRYQVKYQSPVGYLSYSDNKKYLQLKPDITLLDGAHVACIIDAKYKELFFDGKNLEVSQSDIYQMLAYSVRYKCSEIVLAYPRFLEDIQNDLLVHELKIDNYDHTVSIKLIKIDLDSEPELLASNLKNLF